jgi:predicted membrane-bound spermidine synthase
MKWRLFSLAVGLASFATIALELTLTRIFSVTMYYHFAFMVISVAMLGLSVAGVVIYLRRGFFQDRRAPLIAAVAMLIFAVLGAVTLAVTLGNPISLTQWRANLWRLLVLYLATGMTMLASGFAISVAIAAARERIGMVYATDLLGAALGCAFLIVAIPAFSGPGAVLACAAVGGLSAALFGLAAGDLLSTKVKRLIVAAGVAVAAVLFGLAATESEAHRFGLARNSGKFLGNRPVQFEKWNAFSQITVGASKNNDMRWIFIDADAATRIWPKELVTNGYKAMDDNAEVKLAALVYGLRHDATALIIGPGGGTDVHSALRHGVPKVVGVEVNPIIVNDVVKGAYAEYSGDLYRDPRVHVVVDEGRSFIRRAEEPFDTIQATLVDTWAASSSGAFTLSENNIYTVEAFEEFFDHLTPNGVISITRWYSPREPKEFLRLVALAREALERRGVLPGEVGKHFLLPTDGKRRATLLVSRAPFSAADVASLARKAREGGLGLLYSPLPVPPADAKVLQRDTTLSAFIEAPIAAKFLAKLPYDATPTTDDRR